MNARLATIAAIPFLLAACGDDAAIDESDDNREASGEVLEGTISDAMLPIDKVRSQAPLAEPEPGEDGASGAPASDEEETTPGETPAEDVAPADVPVAEPAE